MLNLLIKIGVAEHVLTITYFGYLQEVVLCYNNNNCSMDRGILMKSSAIKKGWTPVIVRTIAVTYCHNCDSLQLTCDNCRRNILPDENFFCAGKLSIHGCARCIQ